MTRGGRPLVEARGLVKHFPVRGSLWAGSLWGGGGWKKPPPVRAVDGVDLAVARGEHVALVGESGSGKSTLGRLLIRLDSPTAGRVCFDGRDLAEIGGRELRRLRRRFQMVFQNPHGSLNPRMRVGAALAEPLAVHGLASREERPERVRELLARVGLGPVAFGRFPHELSGGQRQRIAIARALACEPDFLVADEPVSALDVSVQSQIVRLLSDLSRRLGLAVLFITHDLALVGRIADRVAVLYLGRVVESAPTRRVFTAPQHPYTVGLLAAVPVPDPERRPPTLQVAGEPPDPAAPPGGCRFHPRCPIARPLCGSEEPPLVETEPGHRVACHYPGEAGAEPARGAAGEGHSGAVLG